MLFDPSAECSWLLFWNVQPSHNDQTEPVVQDGPISHEQLHCNQFKKSIGHDIEVMGWPMWKYYRSAVSSWTANVKLVHKDLGGPSPKGIITSFPTAGMLWTKNQRKKKFCLTQCVKLAAENVFTVFVFMECTITRQWTSKNKFLFLKNFLDS